MALKSRIVAATNATVAQAAALLRAGALVAFPTETVYGLGADADNPAAVRALFAAKGRPANHPVIVHIGDGAELPRWCTAIPSPARQLAAAFWPGPLTLILPRAAGVDDTLTGGQPTVGVRVPAHPTAQALLRAFGGGIAAPSANRFGRISPTTAGHVADDLGEQVALILDGGACSVGIESTIVACLDDDAPMLLRPGGIGIEALTAVLGRAPRAAALDAPRASGTLAAHYAPRTPARLVSPAALLEGIANPAAAGRAGVLARTVPRPTAFSGPWIRAAPEPAAYAQALYAHLRALDAAGVTILMIEAPPEESAWLAVRDRLVRATHGTGSAGEGDID